MRRTHSNQMIATLVTLLGIISMALPVAAETIELRGIITEIRSTPPAPFSGVVVGDTWKLSYTFDTTVGDVDGDPSAGQYQNPVSEMELKIGPGEVTGVPGTGAIPSGYGSVIAVNLSISDYADYSAQMGLPDNSAWTQVSLWDNSGTPFTEDSLIAALPTPLTDNFPSARQFFLWKPNSTEIFLIGKLQEDLNRCEEAAEAAEEAALNYESAAKGMSDNCTEDEGGCDDAKLSAINALTQLIDAHQTMLDTCTAKLVFVTSSIHNGNIGGISGADAICNNLASDAGLPGTYRAWISDDLSYPAMTFTKSNDPYVLVDGTVVCENWAALTDTMYNDFSNPINMTEQGDLILDHYDVWTGTNYWGINIHINFEIIESCNEWSTSDNATKAVIGQATSVGGFWTYKTWDTCDQEKRLYCFEQ